MENIANIIGTSNIGSGNTASTSKLTIETPGRATRGNQDARTNILAALDAGEVVGWFFTGAKGRPLPGFCVIAKDKQITFAGRVEDYTGVRHRRCESAAQWVSDCCHAHG
jgi:hypothetical protein